MNATQRPTGHDARAILTRRPARAPESRGRPRAGFSIIELLVALTISATLLTATLVALDAMFKRYSVIADSAGTHVSARVVMHRALAMIRTGDPLAFSPAPDDSAEEDQRELLSTWIQFVSFDDPAAGVREITRLERRAASEVDVGDERVALRGPFALFLVTQRTAAGATTTTTRPLLDGVVDAAFRLRYTEEGHLQSATIDLTINPRGSEYATYDTQRDTWTVFRQDPASGQWVEQRGLSAEDTAPTIRLVATTGPRTGE